MTATGVLFVATRGGLPVSVVLAEPHELAAIAERVPPGRSRDVLDPWHIVSIRCANATGPKLHALGWRQGLANTWITSRLMAVYPEGGMILTYSGNVYSLGRREGTELQPQLHDHLGYALRTWGFTDVR